MTAGVTAEGLGARVEVLEHEVDGEKLVRRHILDQTRRNGDDLAAIKSRLDRVEHRLDGVERKVDTLSKNLPKVVGEVMRDVLDQHERGG